MSSVHDLTPLRMRVREIIKGEIARSTAPELSEFLTAISGAAIVRCVDSPHVDKLMDQLAGAMNTLDEINKEAGT